MQPTRQAELAPPFTIDGVRILQRIASTRVSDVYLGHLEVDDRDVAVKIAKTGTVHAADFLRGCEIQSNLSHPNVLPIYNYGEMDGHCYAIMPYVRGGDILKHLESGLDFQKIIKYIKDIARLCDVIHKEGWLHCDIKPENLLITREQRIRLTDFTSARRIPNSVGRSVWLSPEYCAPEVLAGKAADGRADLYSVGVTLYRLLIGEVPFKAASTQGISLKHSQDPIPKLPSHLAPLQPVMDKALAKLRDERFASGADFCAALDSVRNAASPAIPLVKNSPITTREIRNLVVDQPLLSPRDHMRQEKLSRRRRRFRFVQRVAGVILGIGLAGAGAYYAVVNELVDTEYLLSRVGLGEDPELAQAWSAAQSLRQDPNQGLTSIVAAYRRVLAIAPDHPGAVTELASLNSDWKALVTDALQQGNVELAETRLVDGRAMFPNDVEWAQLETQLQNRTRAQSLLERANGLLAGNGLADLPATTTAIQSLQEALRLAPGLTEVSTRLREIATFYVGEAERAAGLGDLNKAINYIERATTADRDLESLQTVREMIAQATTTQETIEAMLQAASTARAQDRLLAPAGDNAAELYHRVLAIAPDNSVAQQGLLDVTTQVVAAVDNLLVDGRLDVVEEMVSQAGVVGLLPEGLTEMRRRLDNERNRQETVSANIVAARDLMAQGFLTAPLEGNAVAKLREVQQIDPGNELAQKLLTQCAERLAQVAQEAYEVGMQEQAVQYIDLATAIVPDNQTWQTQRAAWAQP